MRTLWIGTNWKMQKTLEESISYAEHLGEFLSGNPVKVNVFVIPPFTYLERICQILRGKKAMVGAQNMHWEDQGAFTGEVSPVMIRDCGAQIIELGHSERRELFGETDQAVNRKVHASLKHGLRPLICVGEPATEKEFGATREFVIRQVRIALHRVPEESMGEVILAYEPVWAIGESGVPADPDYAEEIQGLIRQTVKELYGERVSLEIPILYGGSVNLENAASYIERKDIDGLFVGRTAWKAEGLIQLIQMVEKAHSEKERLA